MGKAAKGSRTFFCETCKPKDGSEPEMDVEALKVHMQTVHGVDVLATQGTREMLMHMDGRDFYQSNFRWTVGGVIFTEIDWQPRRGADKRIWEAQG